MTAHTLFDDIHAIALSAPEDELWNGMAPLPLISGWVPACPTNEVMTVGNHLHSVATYALLQARGQRSAAGIGKGGRAIATARLCRAFLTLEASSRAAGNSGSRSASGMAALLAIAATEMSASGGGACVPALRPRAFRRALSTYEKALRAASNLLDLINEIQ